MKVCKCLLVLGAVFLLISCSSNQDTSQESGDVNYNLISADSSIDQSVANEIKKSIGQRDPVTAVKSVNTDKNLIIAFEIKHRHRFQLDSIRKDIQKKTDKQYPNRTVEVSSDKKLILEIGKLENKIDKQHITKKKLKKEAERLIKLSQDKT